jgi:tagatose 6-phosphate kinase
MRLQFFTAQLESLGRRLEPTMILCVTLNPCLDKTLSVPKWSPGDNVRGHAMTEVVGGKGNNVARALMRLGRWARPVTFLGGNTGQRCEQLLREADGFDPIIIQSRVPTRTILTVRTEATNAQTAFFEPDPEVSVAEADVLLRAVEGMLSDGVEAVTLSGSSPCEATNGLFHELISLSKGRRVPVYLDTYGAPLEAIWGIWPDAIKVNRREAGLHIRRSNLTDADIFDLLGRWARHGVRLGVVTNGTEPVLAQAGGRFFRILPPSIETVNPIGSGDCLLAGLVDSELSGAGPIEVLKHGVACAVANAAVWDAGAIDRAAVEDLESRITLEPVDPNAERIPNRQDQAFVRVGVYARPANRAGQR